MTDIERQEADDLADYYLEKWKADRDERAIERDKESRHALPEKN